MPATNTPQKINIDFSKYADNQLRAKIDSAINFPAAVSFNMLVLPIIFTVVAFIGALLLVWKFSIVIGILLGLAAFTTVPIMAYAFGLSATLGKLVDDSEAVFGAAITLVENIAADLSDLKEVNYSITANQLFKAAAQAVVIPIMVEKIAAKVPIFGRALANRSRKMLNGMINAVDIPTKGIANNANEFAANINSFAAQARTKIGTITSKSRSYLVSPSRITARVLLILHIIVFALVAIPYFL